MSFRSALALSGLLLAAAAGCTHKPNNGGGVFAHTGGPTTIQSTELAQASVRMIDLRNGETFFAIDVPIGKQITFDFDRGDGDDPVYTPDILRYEVKPIGDKYGKLTNAMTAPNAASRMVDVTFKQSPMYAEPAAGSAALRTDTPADRPDWWTARGGAMPDKQDRGYDN